jgi:peptidoglycan/xylan/chitin deacetylase (PgdA/CDA1 family)
LYLLILRGAGAVTLTAQDRAAGGRSVSIEGLRVSVGGAIGRLAFWRNGPVKVRFRAMRTSVRYGERLRVMGMVSPADLDGARVRIEEKLPGRKWRLVATTMPSSKGVFESDVKPLESGTLRAAVRGRGASAEVTVTVAPIVTLRASPTAFWRRPFSVEGRLLPSRAGAVVVVQMQRGGEWVTLRKTRTDGDGRYRVVWKPRRVGKYAYRAVVGESDRLAGAISSTARARTWYMVGLTFDDGPASPYTDEILAILKRYRVRATFFVLGQMVNENPGLVKRAVRQGNLIGNHSYSHPTLTRLSEERLNEELASTSDLVARVSGKRPHWMRPPGGATNAQVNAAARRLGMKVAIWDITTVDWQGGPSYRTITRRAMAQVKPFDMILMHDGGGDRSQTAKAIGHLISQLEKKSYLPVTLDQLYPGKSAPEPTLPAQRDVPNSAG